MKSAWVRIWYCGYAECFHFTREEARECIRKERRILEARRQEESSSSFRWRAIHKQWHDHDLAIAMDAERKKT